MLSTAVTYGAVLSATQLNAKATGSGTYASKTVGGSFVYSSASGTVLSVGSQNLSTIFTPTDTTDYTTATASVMLTINQATPTITWALTVEEFCRLLTQFASRIAQWC